MSNRLNLVTAACLAGLPAVSPPAAALVTSFGAVRIDNSDAPELNGFVTTSLQIDFDASLTGLQLLLDLDTGSVYRDAYIVEFGRPPNGRPPNPGLFIFEPSLEFDSYSGNPFSEVGIGAGAVDLGGSSVASWPFTTTAAPTTLNQAWSTFGHVHDQTGFETYRLSLSNDATGTFSFLASARGVIFRSGGVIRGGVVIVPEPAAAVALGVVWLSLTNRRREPSGSRRAGEPCYGWSRASGPDRSAQ